MTEINTRAIATELMLEAARSVPLVEIFNRVGVDAPDRDRLQEEIDRLITEATITVTLPGAVTPEPEIDPLSATCPACLAEPGQSCIATSSDLPREHLHRLRGLAAAARLARCGTCAGSGWEPTGGGPSSPKLVVCPVCAAMPFAACTESGEPRKYHEVRNRAAEAGLGPCGRCDGIGWRPEGGTEVTGEPAPGTFWERAVLERFARGEPVDLAAVRWQVAALLHENPPRTHPTGTEETTDA